jgi:hypothetical protein
MTRTTTQRALATAAAALLALGGVAACSDEDGDGGRSDEEIQEGRDAVEDLGDEIEQEVDAQDEGSNEDNE